MWRIKQLEGDFYRLKNGKSGLFLEPQGGSSDSGIPFVQNTSSTNFQQQFKFEPVPNAAGFYRLQSRQSSKYISVADGSTSDNAAIVQRSFGDTRTYQQWQISEITCPAGTTALDNAQIYTAEGYREGKKSILTWVSNAENADYFNVEKLDNNGNFTILDRKNAKPLSDFSTKNYYTYTDNLPNEGENSYRITLVGQDAPTV